MKQRKITLTFLILLALSFALSAHAKGRSLMSMDWQELRELGQTGVEHYYSRHQQLFEEVKNDPTKSLEVTKPFEILDKICGQKDCYASRLYWHTDLEKAKEEAKRRELPILSLHLLGRLDQELSCANSRFFRTLLYSNPEIAQQLRKDFVLHWHTVRNAPVVRVDYGDGRELVATITGNSYHLMLDSEGQHFDALPGMIHPAAFQRWLRTARPWLASSKMKTTPEALYRYHVSEKRQLETEWAESVTSPEGSKQAPSLANAPQDSAIAAASLAMTKGMVEVPMVNAFELKSYRSAAVGELRERIETPEVAQLTKATEAQVELHPNTVNLMKRQLAIGSQGNLNEKPLTAMKGNLRRALARDTVISRFVFQKAIHDLYLKAESTVTIEALDTFIYDELFLTPHSDPWLGLYSAERFAALPGNGITER